MLHPPFSLRLEVLASGGGGGAGGPEVLQDGGGLASMPGEGLLARQTLHLQENDSGVVMCFVQVCYVQVTILNTVWCSHGAFGA